MPFELAFGCEMSRSYLRTLRTFILNPQLVLSPQLVRTPDWQLVRSPQSE